MKKTSFLSVLVFAAALTFTGCFNAVFSNIEKEVPLRKGTVSGSVNSIVRFTSAGTEVIVTQTGGAVFYKAVGLQNDASDTSEWKKRSEGGITPLNFSYEVAGTSEDGITNAYLGEMFVKIASDETNLYALTATFYVNDEGNVDVKGYNLYSAPSLVDNWKKIENVGDSLVKGKCTLFCTNAVDPSNRKAYLRGYSETEKNYVYYELSGGSATEKTAMASMKLDDGETASASVAIKSAVWSKIDGEAKFFSSSASVADDANHTYYYAKDNKIYLNKDNKVVEVYSAKYAVMTMGVTADYLIFGLGNPSSGVVGTGGIYHIAIGSDGKPADKISDFESNAAAALTSSYQINALLVEDPVETEMKGNILAAANFKSAGNAVAVSYENVGLWAYYPARGNWNRE